MKARAVVAAIVVVVLAAAGIAWVALRDTGHPVPPRATGGGAGSVTPTPSQSPSGTPVEEPEPGRPISACAPDHPSGAVPKPYWGMHAGDPIGEFPDAPITALNLTTSQTYWDQIETGPGHYDFSRLDAIVSTSLQHGARPMVLLGFTPSFHASKPESPTARATMPDLAAWRAWVTAVVERYGARLDYQVWPEPNIVSNWRGTPEQMARLTAIAGQIIHDRAPEALVVAPATAVRLEPQQRWIDRFWASQVDGTPVADYVDAVALDPFPLERGTPEDALALICDARRILADHGVELPIWTNEINYGVPSGGPAGEQAFYPDDRQVAVVTRTYLLQAAAGVARVYWLGWFSYPGLAVEMYRDGTVTPAGHAFAVVHGWLAGKQRPDCRIEQGVHTCLVTGGGSDLEIHWRVRGTSTVRAPRGATRVETALGEARRSHPGDRVQVGQSPLAVFSAR